MILHNYITTVNLWDIDIFREIYGGNDSETIDNEEQWLMKNNKMWFKNKKHNELSMQVIQ